MVFLIYLTFSEFPGRVFFCLVRFCFFRFFLGLVGVLFCVFCPTHPPRPVLTLVWVIGPLLCGTGRVSGVTVVGWVQVVLDVFRVIIILFVCAPESERKPQSTPISQVFVYRFESGSFLPV